jgi:hypothetical protein
MGSGREVHMSDLRKITTKHKAKYTKGSDGFPPIKTTCAKGPTM